MNSLVRILIAIFPVLLLRAEYSSAQKMESTSVGRIKMLDIVEEYLTPNYFKELILQKSHKTIFFNEDGDTTKIYEYEYGRAEYPSIIREYRYDRSGYLVKVAPLCIGTAYDRPDSSLWVEDIVNDDDGKSVYLKGRATNLKGENIGNCENHTHIFRDSKERILLIQAAYLINDTSLFIQEDITFRYDVSGNLKETITTWHPGYEMNINKDIMEYDVSHNMIAKRHYFNDTMNANDTYTYSVDGNLIEQENVMGSLYGCTTGKVSYEDRDSYGNYRKLVIVRPTGSSPPTLTTIRKIEYFED